MASTYRATLTTTTRAATSSAPSSPARTWGSRCRGPWNVLAPDGLRVAMMLRGSNKCRDDAPAPVLCLSKWLTSGQGTNSRDGRVRQRYRLGNRGHETASNTTLVGVQTVRFIPSFSATRIDALFAGLVLARIGRSGRAVRPTLIASAAASVA